MTLLYCMHEISFVILSKFYTILLKYVVIIDNIIGIGKTPI